MSSSSPPPPSVVIQKSKQKKKHKDKGKSKGKEKASVHTTASETREGHGRNEGVDPNWAYQPPDGMVALETSQVDEEFDWDALKNDENKEVWIVRIPEGFKTKHLDGLEIKHPMDTLGTKLATLERKRAKYDVWSVDPSNSEEPVKEDDQQPPRAEEIKNVSCLLPRKKKNGKLYIAPNPIAKRIVITHAAATPNIDDSAAPTPSTRHSVPKHLLKHRFLPSGALSPADGVWRVPDTMDVDVQNDVAGTQTGGKTESLQTSSAQPRTPGKKYLSSPGKPSSKKRRNAAGESETPTHKSKKLKI